MNNAEIDYQVNLINSFNIQHPTLKTGLNVIKMAYDSVKMQREQNQGSIPSYYRPQCGIIVGDAGSGKTTFCNFVKNSLPETQVVSDGFKKQIIPCVYVSIANMNTPKTVTARIVEQFGQKVPARASEDDLLRQVKSLFSTCETSLVLLDEIHEILPGVGRNRVMSWLKSLVNETKVSIFVAGTHEAKDIAYSNAELQGRFVHSIELHYMKHSLTNPHAQFGKYLTALLLKITETLSFDNVFSPTHQELGQLYLATDGNLRSISTLFIEASRMALKSKSNNLTMDFMNSAFNQKTMHVPHRYRGSKNPFILNGEELNNQLKMLSVQ